MMDKILMDKEFLFCFSNLNVLKIENKNKKMNLNYMQTLYIFPSYRLIYVSLSLNGDAPKEINRFKDESISFFFF